MNSRTLLALTLALSSAGTSLAAGTAANTKIRNQAVADFTDSDGVRQTTKSNEVFTVVQPVYSYSITPDETTTGKTPARENSVPNTGAPRYFAYYVTNSGNATDRIFLTPTVDSSTLTGTPTFKLYYDSTPNGQVDSGEIELSKDTGVYYVDAAADQTVNIVAEIRLPVQGSVVAGTQVTYNLVGDSSNLAGASDESGDPKNTVRLNVSNDAGFQVTKDASLADLVDRGGNLKYTIQGSNNGATAASPVEVTVDGTVRNGILVEDSLPVDGSGNQLAFLTTALGTSAVSSPSNYVYSGRGVALPIYFVHDSGTNTDVWTATFSAAAKRVGLLIQGNSAGTDTSAFFQPGDQFTLVFNTRVDNDTNSGNTPDATILAVGTAINNTAAVNFKKNIADTGTTTPSNTRINHVAPAYAVAVGDKTAANFDNNSSEETYTTGGSAYLGQTYTWTVSLTNNGNTTDHVKLNLDSATQLQNVTLSYINGTSITPNDPIVVAVGSTVTIRVTGTVPLTATVGSPAGVRLLADSANVAGVIGDTNKSLTTPVDAADSVILRSLNVQNPYSVDGAVDDDMGTPSVSKTGDSNLTNDSTNTATAPSQYLNVNPGTTAYYPVEIRNTGIVTDTFDLSVGSGVELHTFTDSNADGNWDIGEPIGSAVTTTPQLAPGAAQGLVLTYTVATNQAPGNITLPVTATSTTMTSVSDTFSVIFVVQANNQVTFTPDRVGSIVPGGVVDYTHTFSNNGNTHVSFDLGNVMSGTPLDGNDGTSDKSLIYTYAVNGSSSYVINPAALCVAPGASIPVKVRVEAPSNVPIGTEDPEILSGAASFYSDSNCTTQIASAGSQTLSVTDTTTVVGTLIKVEKKVKNLGPKQVDADYSDNNTGFPDDVLEYRIRAYNNGNLDVYGLVVSDKMPADTTFVNFEVDSSKLPAGSNVYVSAEFDPQNPSAAAWVLFSDIDTSNDGKIDLAEWNTRFSPLSFDTLFVGLDTDGDTQVEFNTQDKIEPSQGATVLFRVKIK